MSLVTRSASDVFAPVTSAGQPRGADMGEVRTWALEVQRLAVAAAESGGAILFASRPSLFADLSAPNNAMAWVLGDPVDAQNGVYRKSGAAGVGAWVWSGRIANQADIDALIAAINNPPNGAADPSRPGEAPGLWSNTIAGGDLGNVPALAAAVIDTFGRTVRLSGAGVVAPRRYWAMEPRRLYQVRYVVQRRANAPDPANDTVRFAVAWYTASYAAVGGTPTTLVKDISDLVTADNRTEVTMTLAAAPGTDIDIVAPSGARFFRPYVQTFGVGSQTDVEVVSIVDVTDGFVFSPDLSVLESQVGALLAADLPARVEEIEETLDGPGVKTFITIADAQAGTVPTSVNILRILCRTLADDPIDAIYRLTTGDDYDIPSLDGKRWQVHGNVLDLAAFGVNGGNDPTDDVKIARAFARVPPGGVLRMPRGSFRAPPDGIERSDIFVKGAGAPQVASGGAALTGGSRWLGHFSLDGDNLFVEDMGFDAGATVMGAGAAVDACYIGAADNFTSGATRKNIKIRNLVGLCKNNTAGVHGILMQGLDGFEIEGLMTHLGMFGSVIKGTNGFVKNTRANQYGVAGLTAKSDHYAPCGMIDIDGVMGETTSAAADGLLAVHAATASLARWSARGVKSTGGKRSVILIGSRRPSGAPVPYSPGPPEVQGTFPYCALSDFTISDCIGLGYSFRGFETYGALFNGRISGIQMLTTVGSGTIGFYTDEHTLDLDIEDVTVNGPSYNAAAVRLGGYFRARNITSIVGNMGTPNGINRAYLGGDAAVSVVTPYYGTLSG